MHVYPHPALPLLPKLLVPALSTVRVHVKGVGETLPQRCADAANCQAMDADLRQSTAETISALVQKVIYGRQRDRVWSEVALNVPSHLRLTDLKLTDRALVSLQSKEFFANDGLWRSATLEEVIGQRGSHRIGARLLLAFLLAAEEAELGREHPQPKPARGIEGELSRLVRGVIHSGRTAAIYLDMNGWGGRGQRGLTEIASAMSMTHERARQIGAAGTIAMHKVTPGAVQLPVLSKALEMLASIAPCPLGKADELVQRARATHGEFTASAVIGAGECFGVPHAVLIDRVEGQPFLLKAGQKRLLTAIRHAARKFLRADGILEISSFLDYCQGLLGRADPNLDATHRAHLIDVALKTMPGWSYLDTDRQWATVTQGANGEDLHPRGPAARMGRLAVFFGGVNLEDAQAALRQRQIDWPPQILLALCMRSGLTVRPEAQDWRIQAQGEVASRIETALHATAEYQIAELLAQSTRTLDRTELIAQGERIGLHRSTVQACLKSASLFHLDQAGTCRLATNDQRGTRRAKNEAA